MGSLCSSVGSSKARSLHPAMSGFSFFFPRDDCLRTAVYSLSMCREDERGRRSAHRAYLSDEK